MHSHLTPGPAGSFTPAPSLQALPAPSLQGCSCYSRPCISPSSFFPRHPCSLKKNTHTYFYTSFAAYIFGLGLTIFIMHIFKHAQVSRTYVACQEGFPTEASYKGFICHTSNQRQLLPVASEQPCLIVLPCTRSYRVTASAPGDTGTLEQGEKSTAAILFPASRLRELSHNLHSKFLPVSAQ